MSNTTPADVAAAMSSYRTAIIGLGITGRSCIRHLQGHELIVLDTRDGPGLRNDLPAHPALEVHTGVQEFDFSGVDQVIVSPGVSLDVPLLDQARRIGVPLRSDIELFMAATTAPVFGITGTNGKSTVTAMTGALLEDAGYQVKVGGNLGEPALDLLTTHCDFYVLELSSFQLERMQPATLAGATVLNVTEDHIDRHGSLEAYGAVKRTIFERAAVCAINRADGRTKPTSIPVGRVTSFGLDSPAQGEWGRRMNKGQSWFARGDRCRLPTADLTLSGLHNQENFLAACAVLDDLTLPDKVLHAVATGFSGLPHRCVSLGERRGVRYVNDSKATNVGATLAAVNGIAPTLITNGRIVLLAGGDGKGADFSPLQSLAGSLRGVVVYGRDAAQIETTMQGVAATVRVTNFEDAILRAAALAEPGDCVLLAPACASLDMFANYSARGRRFAELVEALPA